MYAKKRRNLAGQFSARTLGPGAWHLARSEPAPADIFLRGAESGAADALGSPDLKDVDIEWQADTVLLTMTAAERRGSFKAYSAIVHEPLARLYDDLPLVILDEKARRFWRRVFRLVRIPGGRHLLGILARRTRQPR
jgi:hypothetical protein